MAYIVIQVGNANEAFTSPSFNIACTKKKPTNLTELFCFFFSVSGSPIKLEKTKKASMFHINFVFFYLYHLKQAGFLLRKKKSLLNPLITVNS